MVECKTKKDDALDQNTLSCCYGHYVTSNQQTQINKTCSRENVKYPCQSISA